MRTLRRFTVVFLLPAVVTTAAAQSPDEGPPRFYAGAALGAAQPMGDFADYVGTSFAFGGHLLYSVDRAGVFGLRLDGGWVLYGKETQTVPLSPTIGGRILVDLETTNNIGMLSVGPQLMLPNGTFRPYVNGSVGIAYYNTVSSVEGTREDRDFASTTNYDDVVLALGGGAGIYIPVRRGRTPISIDLGVRYQHTGQTSYLREGGIIDNPDGSITLQPIRSETDLLTFQAGVSIALRDSDRHEDRGDQW